jgi:hypothetical protein
MWDEYMVKSETFPPNEMTHCNHRSRLRQGQRPIPKDTLRDAAVYLTRPRPSRNTLLVVRQRYQL